MIVDTDINVSSESGIVPSVTQRFLLGGTENCPFQLLPHTSVLSAAFLSFLLLDSTGLDLTLSWPKFIDGAQSTSFLSNKADDFPEKGAYGNSNM